MKPYVVLLLTIYPRYHVSARHYSLASHPVVAERNVTYELPRELKRMLRKVSTNAVQWNTIQKTTDIIRGYHAAAEDVIQTMEDILSNSTSDISLFLSNLDDLPVVKEVRTIPESDCKAKFTDMKQLKNSFRLQRSHLEGPVVKRISDIKGRFREIWGSLAVYQGLADGKWWACQIEEEECANRTQNWLDENLQSLLCKLVPNCQKRVIKKREAIQSISCARLEYPFTVYGRSQCYSIESYTCDGSCNNSPCLDEPSSGCSRYCVDGYHCTNLQCIDKNKVCDGKDDCGDGSDETGCSEIRNLPLQNCTLEAGKYLCSDRSKCIELWRSCDGQADCSDGSDEGTLCFETDCGAGCLAAGGVCLPTARGGVCLSHCPPGTQETPLGCRSGPSLPPATLAELLDDTPRLTSRYLAGVKLLQSRVVDELAASLSRVAACMDKLTSFDSILRLSDFLTSTTKPPHTATKHHTTTHRTTTQPTNMPMETTTETSERDYPELIIIS